MVSGTQKTEMRAELPASLELPAVEQTAAVTSGLWFWFLRTASQRRLVRSSVTTPLRLEKKEISCFSAAENVIVVSHVGFCLVKEKNLKQKVFLVKGGVLAGVLDVSVGKGAGLEEEKGRLGLRILQGLRVKAAFG